MEALFSILAVRFDSISTQPPVPDQIVCIFAQYRLIPHTSPPACGPRIISFVLILPRPVNALTPIAY